MKEFIEYLSSLYGALAGMSVLFPFANELADVICIAPEYQSNALTLSSLACSFTILITYARGSQAYTNVDQSVTAGFLAAFFIAIVFAVPSVCESVISMGLYVAIFVLVTFAFGTAGAKVYFEHKNGGPLPPAQAQQRQSGFLSHTPKALSFLFDGTLGFLGLFLGMLLWALIIILLITIPIVTGIVFTILFPITIEEIDPVFYQDLVDYIAEQQSVWNLTFAITGVFYVITSLYTVFYLFNIDNEELEGCGDPALGFIVILFLADLVMLAFLQIN